MAKCHSGTFGWYVAPRVLGSNHCRRRGALAANAVRGLASFARHRAPRSHIACANSGRITPPIRQDLVSDRDNPSKVGPFLIVAPIRVIAANINPPPAVVGMDQTPAVIPVIGEIRTGKAEGEEIVVV